MTLGEEIQKSTRSHFPLSIYNKSAYEVVEKKERICLGSFLQCTLAHLPGPAGKIMQVFACRRILLIREQARQWKPVCRYFQVKLFKQQDYGMISNVPITGKFSSFD